MQRHGDSGCGEGGVSGKRGGTEEERFPCELTHLPRRAVPGKGVPGKGRSPEPVAPGTVF
ncbi:hypothetical protein GCM10010446_35540 [Streptomyces enissocaesilis]|uniref:Uncharacterized protein n=1 Tax=Streptomyces enissocaesilis TaxID=332589 RepID=A0ABP6JUD8_9ACTN